MSTRLTFASMEDHSPNGRGISLFDNITSILYISFSVRHAQKQTLLKMTRVFPGLLLAAVLTLLLPSLVLGSSPPLKPLKTEELLTIDGKLDEPVWQKAPYVTGFKTFTPDFGIDMVEKTEVYMAYDSENLYFGFKCFDSRPDKIKTSISRRDNIRPDDWVCINLDSFNDQQALYALYINPMGIQQDSRFASGQEDFSVDLVWYSAGQILPQGYTIEVQIPLKSIRFAHKEIVEMGVIFERKISRRSEQGTFPPLDPERGYFFLTQMAPMEYHGLKRYTLVELLPAYTHSQDYSQKQGKLATEDPARDISLTAKYGLTPKLILDATFNPDFSQVEADAGQVDVNLRYDLFYPEKRPFFLEGRENFNIAGILHADPLHSLVHTRKIVDPKAGFKLSGKIGKKDTIASIFALDELPFAGPPGINIDRYASFTIFRYKRALAQDSYLGAIYTGRDHNNRFNRVLGSDGQIRLNQSSMLGFHAFASFTKGEDLTSRVDGHALSLDYMYDTRKLGFLGGVQDLSEHFWTETGYMTRTGIVRIWASIAPKIYPKASPVRRIDPSLNVSLLKDHPSDLYETQNTAALSFLLWRNTRINFGYTYATEIFLAQQFQTSGWHLRSSSQITKQLYFNVFLKGGKAIRYATDPYQAKGKRASILVIYQPSHKINLQLDATYSDLFRNSDSEKIYDYTILRTKSTFQVNKYLFFRGIIEYNSFYKNLLSDLLVSFTYIPGTVLQLGYGSLYEKLKWENGRYQRHDQFLETKRGLFFKASYLWRF